MTIFERDGFVLHRDCLVGQELLARSIDHTDRVIAGEYETGVGPPSGWKPGDDPKALVKIDNAHMCDETLQQVISHPALGAFAASMCGADMVQVWATQLLHKPGGGQALGHVGWHQDDTYWHNWWDGEVFTVWLALADVEPEMGPMVFVRGSHTWGFREGGNFFSTDLDSIQQAMVPAGHDWHEIDVTLPAGGASMHHRRLVHGSKANVSQLPRRGFAVHMRTERSMWTEQMPYKQWMDDDFISPVVFRR